MTGVKELMGQSVWDAHGVWVGHIVDVRVKRSRDTGLQSHTLMGLLVSANRAPWLLSVTPEPDGSFGWISRLATKVLYARCTYVPWEIVDAYGDGEVHIKGSRKDLDRV